jgi:ribosomal protein L11 methyltransferase
MNSIQITIQAKEDQQEILISLLNECEAEGFEQNEEQLIAYFSEQNFNSYEVNEILKDYTFQSAIIKEQNWNKVWESNFQPVIVDSFCAIRAEFHPEIKDVKYEIVITPKMSFGTGHHATTYMMIEQMSQMDFQNKTVFDFGTGTGILAILAEYLGASKILAIDVDEWSVENANENITRNQCTKIEIKKSTDIPDENFDIILANINRNVILEYLPQLKSTLTEGKFLLLSGLLTEDEGVIVEACRSEGLSLIKRLEKNNWISLLFITGK